MTVSKKLIFEPAWWEKLTIMTTVFKEFSKLQKLTVNATNRLLEWVKPGQTEKQIAEKYEKGAKKHVMGWEAMPQWASGYEDAIALYDEVISTLPRHDIAAKATFNKAGMLAREEKYKESIELFQNLIRKFPKHQLAPESYLAVARTYFEESQNSLNS